MLTLQRYIRFPDAYLAKTLLEDYGVFCSLFDENVHCLGYYFIFPIRLMVADGQLQRAARILAYAESSPIPEDDVVAGYDKAAPMLLDETIFGDDEKNEFDEQSESNNPWEILAIAYLFLIPGIGFLLEHRRLLLWSGRRRTGWLVLSPFELHMIGATLICVATFLIGAYFYTLRTIAGEDLSDVGDSPEASAPDNQ